MKIVYVPQHLYPALKKANLRSQELGDTEKLLSTLSADDVAFYFYTNDPLVCPIPKEVAETLPNLIFGPTQVMPFTGSEGSRAALKKFNSLKHNGSSASLYEDDAVLSTDCMEEDLIIVTHTAPTDAGASGEVTKSDSAFYDRIIQQLLAFKTAEQVMAMPLLLGWLRSVQADAKVPNA